jgi:putative transposase
VERNPVRAKMTTYAWEYQWSSAAYHVGIEDENPLVTESDLLKKIDDWQEYLSEQDSDIEKLRLNTRTGRPIGGESFVEKAEKIVSRVLRPGKAGRPRRN